MQTYLKKIFTLFILSLLTLFFVAPVAAATEPTFPSCVNPQGTVKVSYSEGTHGIVGSSQNYSGSDAVYTISNSALTQCFCPTNGDGIQTNWWKYGELSQEEIDVLVAQGWTWVPNGLVWGLDDAPYLAKNINYSCRASVGGSSDNNNSSSNNSSNNTGGSVLSSTTGDILGLASTGNIATVYTFLGLGILFIFLGLWFKKSKK